MNVNGSDLVLLKQRLRGSNLKKLLLEKKVSKWRVAKDCGITYRTLLNWQKGFTEPSDENAIIVGSYLGLIKPKEKEMFNLKAEFNTLKEKLERLSSD
jgi:hypothetical protein